MLNLIRFDTLLKWVVISIVSTSIAIHYCFQLLTGMSIGIFRLILISSALTAVIGFVILSPNCYRWLWLRVRKVFPSVFPDLSGNWAGTITTDSGQLIEVRAIIRQSLLITEIDMHGKTMKSITLAAAVAIEAGQRRLYYIYRAEPKEPKWPPYSGTTRFTVRGNGNGDPLMLSGQYYTDRKTAGTIELTLSGADVLKDVSYY